MVVRVPDGSNDDISAPITIQYCSYCSSDKFPLY